MASNVGELEEPGVSCAPASPRILTPVMVVSLWAAAAIIAVVVRGPVFVSIIRPPPGDFPDFVQEWVSGRNYWHGEPVYQPQRATVFRNTGFDYPDFETMMRWNAHPPVAVLAVLPFGLIADYRAAHLVWNLCTLALFLTAVWLALRELGARLHPWSVFPAITLLLCADPVLSQLFQGQLNFLIAFLVVAGWVADRRDYQSLAGVAVGAAIALKLFPGLLLVYFLGARRWRAAIVAILIASGLNAIAAAAFGIEAFTTYIREVIPSLEVFRNAWSNVSVAGYWRRVARSVGVPEVALIGLICQGAVGLAIVWRSWRASTVEERDQAYSLAVIGMLLASPVAWGHYFVLLALPFLLLWWRLPIGSSRTFFLALAGLFFLPVRIAAIWTMGRDPANELQNHLPAPDGIDLSLGAFGLFTYALAAMFILTATARIGKDAD